MVAKSVNLIRKLLFVLMFFNGFKPRWYIVYVKPLKMVLELIQLTSIILGDLKVINLKEVMWSY